MHMSIIKCCNHPDMTRLRTLCFEGDDVPPLFPVFHESWTPVLDWMPVIHRPHLSSEQAPSVRDTKDMQVVVLSSRLRSRQRTV
jgi:hypothetical protein